MAGGSFMNPPGASGPTMAQSLFAQMDSMRRASVGVQDIWANQMFGAGPYGGMGRTSGMAGDAMFRLNQSLEQLNQQFQNSPLLSGRGMMGGAGFSSGQMFAASVLGAPVQVQGLPGGAAGPLGRMMMAENVTLAMENLERRAMTQLAPGMIGAAASLLPGGAILGPMAGAAAQALAPGIMRNMGLDAQLQRGEMARQFRRDIGDRLAGGSVTGRFIESFAAGRDLSGAMTQYIADQQKQYNYGGILNFGLNAEEYAPLQQAMISTMTQTDLNRLVKSGGKGIKEQMDALIAVSATLNMTFEETAKLAEQFGEVSGGPQALANYVNTIENAAQRAGGGMRRGLAAQFGLAMRAQARQLGLQGELSAANAVQDVGVLQGLIKTAAGQRLLSMDQLAAFGGNTEQERVQNMVAAMFGAGAQVAQGPIGGMIRANIMGGGGPGAAFRGGLLDFMGGAGAAFARDPFGFQISMADPRVNQQVQSSALFGQMFRMEQAFGGLDPRAAQAAFISQARQMGISATQAGAMFNFYQANKATAEGIADTHGRTAGDVMGIATAYAARTGITMSEALAQLRPDGELTLAQAELVIQGVFGAGKVTGGNVLTDAEIERRAKAVGASAGRSATYKMAADRQADYDKAFEKDEHGKSTIGQALRGIKDIYATFLRSSSEYGDASAVAAQAEAAERQRLLAERASALSSQAELRFASMHRADLGRFGISVGPGGGIDVSGFRGGGTVSAQFEALVKAMAGGGDVSGAVAALGQGQGFDTLLSTINALMSGLDESKLGEVSAAFGLDGALADRKLTVEEVGKGGNLGALVTKLNSITQGRGATSLALNALKPMFTETTAITSALNEQTDALHAIRENTAKMAMANK